MTRITTVLLAVLLIGAVFPAAAQDCEAGFRLFNHELLATDPICVPEAPQRVAFLDQALMNGYALGVESVTRNVYLDTFIEDFPTAYSEAALAAMTDIGYAAEASPEALLNAQPDLIVSALWWPEANEFAAEIAPTVIFDYERTTDWRLSFMAVAELLGRTDEAEAILEGIDARLSVVRGLLPEADAPFTYAVVRTTDDAGQLQVFTTMNFGAQHLERVGLSMLDSVLTPAESAEVNRLYWYPLSVEELPMIDADHVFLLEGWEADVQQTFLESPLWAQLSAVAESRVWFIEGEYWIRDNPIAAHRIIDDLLVHLVGVDPEEVAPNPFRSTYVGM